MSEQVLPYVRVLGDHLLAKVELLHVLARSGRKPIGISTRAMARDHLEKVASSLRRGGLFVSCTVTEGEAATEIIKEAQSDAGSVVAMCTRGHSGITRWVIGSTTDKVLRASAVPVLAVHPQGQEAHVAPTELRTLVVPLDGSSQAEQVMPHVVGLAKALALTVHLVRVTPSMDDYSADMGYSADFYEALCRQADAEAVTYLREVDARFLQEGVPGVRRSILHGHPVVAIGDFAQQTPNCLIAMTTRGRSGVGRWVLGSVTDKVVRHSGSAVLVVPCSRPP